MPLVTQQVDLPAQPLCRLEASRTFGGDAADSGLVVWANLMHNETALFVVGASSVRSSYCGATGSAWSTWSIAGIETRCIVRFSSLEHCSYMGMM